MSETGPKYLFESLDGVRRQLSGLDRIVMFLDLDGTLAPIAPRPPMVRIKPETRQALDAIVQDKTNCVAIVSGRGIDDLKSILKLSEMIYAGNHGLEIGGLGLEYIHPEAKEHAVVIRKVCATLKSKLRLVQGAIVEFKNLTGTVHYRLVAPAEVDRIRLAVAEAVAPFGSSIRVTEGRRALELRPGVAWDKGAAVRWILDQTGNDEAAAIYVGDDKTDEDAFRVLPGAITVHVGTKLNLTAARFFVRSPDGVVAFMQHLPAIRSSSRATGNSLARFRTATAD